MSIPTTSFTIPRNLSNEAADIQRALNSGYPFPWNVLEADEGTYFYQRVREDGTVRTDRPRCGLNLGGHEGGGRDLLCSRPAGHGYPHSVPPMAADN